MGNTSDWLRAMVLSSNFVMLSVIFFLSGIISEIQADFSLIKTSLHSGATLHSSTSFFFKNLASGQLLAIIFSLADIYFCHSYSGSIETVWMVTPSSHSPY